MTLDLVIGADVSCTDGVYGGLTHVIVDTNLRLVIGAIVQPRHRFGLGRRVDFSLIDSGSRRQVTLRCSRQDLDAEEVSESTEVVGPGAEHQVGRPTPTEGWRGTSPDLSPDVLTHVNLEAGAYALGDQPILAPDGRHAEFEGVRTQADGAITDVLVVEGHLRRREAVVPVAEAVLEGGQLRFSASRADSEGS
jgi:hypothetical protein